MFIINNLLSLLEEKGLKQADLCEAIGISSSTMTNWKNRGTDPPAKHIVPICEFLDISPYLLLTGKEKSSPTVELTDDERELLDIYNNLSPKSQGQVKERAIVLSELEAPVADEPEQEEPKVIMIRFVPLSVSAGTGEPLPEDSRSTYLKIKHSDIAEEADYAVRINGDSMLPRFKDNDIVLVKAQEQVDEGNIGIFTVDGSGYIKEYAKDRLISLNPEYEDIYFREGQELDCQGLVIAALEKEDFV